MTSQATSLDGLRICLVTTGQPSTNPRLVKEADALTEAGAEVHVVACKFKEWAEDADAVFLDRKWTIHWVRFGKQAPRWKDIWQRLRRKGARMLTRQIGPQPGLAERALHYVVPELTQLASKIEASLYIGHNLPALPAAYRAASKSEAALGFDAEDYHRGELPDTPEHVSKRRLRAWIEERYIPECDYITAASKGIGNAYSEALGIDPPTTILNVFPWAQREHHVPSHKLSQEVPDGRRSIYWFSQTIGPDRGLEDALRALPRLPADVVLSLRGGWAPGYEEEFLGKARRLGVADRVYHLELVPPDELIRRTAEHDVGLALEQPAVSKNRTICLTNKLFTYLLAGIPFVATDTPGQRPVMQDLPDVAQSYDPGEVEEFVHATATQLNATGLRDAALQAARGRYCWEVEKQSFLEVVCQTLDEDSPISA